MSISFPRTQMRRLRNVTLSCLAVLFVTTSQAHAANWLMLQGVEHPKKPDQYLFAFIQPTYFQNEGTNLSGLTDIVNPNNNAVIVPFSGNNGEDATANTVPPRFNEKRRLDIQRARIGSRGRFTGGFENALTKKMNYFVLFETAPNLLTYDAFGQRDRPIALDHASLTFNHIPGARIRLGLFKNPTSEELFQGIATFNYIQFTDFSARENLERFFEGGAQPAGSPGSPALGAPQSESYGFSAVRDWGVQVFDSFKRGKWDLSYAVKVGRGEAISRSESTHDGAELYLYGSAEYNLPGGRGPRKNGVKFFAWHQSGEREFETDATDEDYDRERYGVGMQALGKFFGLKYKQRFGIELMGAEGMLFLGPSGGVANGAVNNGAVQIAADDDNKSRAITIDYGFYLNKKWQFDIRYDRHELLYSRASNINPGNEREFENWTLGATYHFTPKRRLTFNYTFRDVDTPNDYASTGFVPGFVANGLTRNVDRIANSIDDRLALQLTWIF